MFGQVLVTASLLDSFEFALNAPQSWKDTAMKDFIAKIRREHVDYPEWVRAGMKFEDTVYRVCNKSKYKEEAMKHGSKNFQKVVELSYGGTFQNKLKRTVTIGSERAFFFGFTDIDFPDMTKDLKTAMSWKGPQKYLNKTQHKLYLWMNGKDKFQYVVVVWVPNNIGTIQDVHTIDYTAPSHEVLETEIIKRTECMFEFIRELKLWDDYYTIFSKN